MAKTFKVGDKVRILDVDKIAGGRSHWSNGDIAEVLHARTSDGGLRLTRTNTGKYNGFGPVVVRKEYEGIELADGVPTNKQRIETLEKASANLVTEVEALKAEVAELKKAQKPYVIGVDLAITPNQRRKAVIERAKAFVADVEYLALDSGGNTERWSRKRAELKQFSNCVTKPEYHVNKEKRVVTVLVKGAITTVLFEKAIAKCAPGDVFNVHIGKAIALAKAYGLNCPQEFTDAPQPEIAVGQVVAGGVNAHNYYGKDKQFTLTESRGSDTFYYAERTPDWIRTSQIGEILDDSEAVYE